MKLTVTVDMDEATLYSAGESEEIARILRRAADDAERGAITPGYFHTWRMNVDGDRVGTARVEE